MHQGAIYRYRPIFWLNHPLWIVRDRDFSPPPPFAAHLYRQNDLRDAFRGGNGNEEDVVARAKRRFLVVLSPQVEIDTNAVKKVLVAPLYSITDRTRPDIAERVRRGELPHVFYLPADYRFQNVRERYIKYHEIRFLDKRFLGNGKVDYCLSPKTTKAVVQWYRNALAFR